MSMRTRLEVTPTFRGDDYTRPVHVGHDGTRVVLVADGKHAEVLARMIARVTGELRDVDDVDQALWETVVVDVLAAKALAGTDLPDPVDVPVALEVVR